MATTLFLGELYRMGSVGIRIPEAMGRISRPVLSNPGLTAAVMTRHPRHFSHTWVQVVNTIIMSVEAILILIRCAMKKKYYPRRR